MLDFLLLEIILLSNSKGYHMDNKQTKTNFDFIKKLTPECFVEFLRDYDHIFSVSVCAMCSHKDDCNDNCEINIIDWLKQERQDG